MISDDQRRQTAASQAALREDVTWVQQPLFDRAWSDLTGEQIEHEAHEINWNFTADDVSFAQ